MFLPSLLWIMFSEVLWPECYGEDLTVFHLGDRDFGSLTSNPGLNDKNWRKPKYIDVYTNYPDRRVVENVFYHNYNLQRKSPDTLIDRKDTLKFDIFPDSASMESEYGQIVSDSFHSSANRKPDYYDVAHQQASYSDKRSKYKEKDHYVFLQSQIDVPNLEIYGSSYPASNYNKKYNPRPHSIPQTIDITKNSSPPKNNLEVTTGSYSYIQKIPVTKNRPSTTASHGDSIKYEEIDLKKNNQTGDTNLDVPNTRSRINELLKKYLVQIFVEKYADTKVERGNLKINNNNAGLYGTDVSSSINTSRPKASKIDQESKFLTADTLWELKNKTISKIKKLFSIFTVIKFNNTECNATNWAGTWQGACYTSTECSQLGGSTLGNCANGYGVCCVFRGSCGDSTTRNCSYFKSPNYPDFYPSNGEVATPTTTMVSPTSFPTPDPRLHWYHYNQGGGDVDLDTVIYGRQRAPDTTSCTFSVFKSSPDVKQMRIDFIDLDLSSPTNGTCVNERLVISGQNSNNQIPVICGYNTGLHVYVDVSQMTGPLQLMVLSTMGERKRFKMRVCQFTNSCSTPQSNCLQYYTGTGGIIQSFNYDQAAMFNRSTAGYFNNLNYAICIRREDGYCSITYTNVRNGQVYPFQMVNALPNGQLIIPPGQAGVDILNCPDDYVIIDGTRLCGDRFNDGSTVFNFSRNAPVTGEASPHLLHLQIRHCPVIRPISETSIVFIIIFSLMFGTS